MKYRFIVLFGAALLSTAAIADDTKPAKGANATFESLDKDSDGRLSQSESTTSNTVSSQFASLDRDGDGYITKDEFKANTMPKQKTPGREY